MTKIIQRCAGGALILALMSGSAGASDALSFSLPLDCTLGETCFLQNYVDVDPTENYQNHRCIPMTYDGHRGTDFRVLPGAGVPVIAAAPGRVLRVRDGVPDRTLSGSGAFPDGQNCGNGVVIDHGEGWTTISCHLENGSILVEPGQTVERGTPLGGVGLSGATEFRHVHLGIMKDGEPVDPFTGRSPSDLSGCQGGPGEPIWTTDVMEAVEAIGDTHIVAVGLTDGSVSTEEIQDLTVPPLAIGANAVVGYGLVVAPKAGDEHRLLVEGPSMRVPSSSPQERFQAQAMRFAGRRTPEGAAPGEYTVLYQIVRDGVVIDEATAVTTLR